MVHKAHNDIHVLIWEHGGSAVPVPPEAHRRRDPWTWSVEGCIYDHKTVPIQMCELRGRDVAQGGNRDTAACEVRGRGVAQGQSRNGRGVAPRGNRDAAACELCGRGVAPRGNRDTAAGAEARA